MSILINQEALRLAYKLETGFDRLTFTSDIGIEPYIEWLEEKVSLSLEKEKQHKSYLALVDTLPHGAPFDEEAFNPDDTCGYTEIKTSKLKHINLSDIERKKAIDQSNFDKSCPMIND